MRPYIAVLVFESLAVLKHHQRSRNRWIVLRRHVDPIGVLSAGIGVAGQLVRPANLAFRDAFLWHRVGSQPILGIRIRAGWRRRRLSATSPRLLPRRRLSRRRLRGWNLR